MDTPFVFYSLIQYDSRLLEFIPEPYSTPLYLGNDKFDDKDSFFTFFLSISNIANDLLIHHGRKFTHKYYMHIGYLIIALNAISLSFFIE